MGLLATLQTECAYNLIDRKQDMQRVQAQACCSLHMQGLYTALGESWTKWHARQNQPTGA